MSHGRPARASRWPFHVGAAAALLGMLWTPPGSWGGGTKPAPGSWPPIVFVSRHPVLDEDGAPMPGAIPGLGPRDRTARVGGRLLVRESDGSLRTLVSAPTLFDVADPCVSWDGARIAFAGLVHPDSSWRIYEIRRDGKRLRQLTRTDRALSLAQFGAAAARFTRYDDIDPCWLPDGRICFASTRYPMLAETGDYLATNLFVLDAGGAAPRRITTERSGGEEPSVDPLTGRIVYARWWINLDRPSNQSRDGLTYLDDQALPSDIGNIWQTISITPDGRGARLHAGDPRSRPGMVCHKPALLADGRVLTVFAANGSFAPAPGPTGIRLFAPGADTGRSVVGFTGHASDESAPGGSAFSGLRWATDPIALADDLLLVAYAPAAGDFGLHVCALDGSGLAPVVDLPGTLELDAAVLAARPVPPRLADQADPTIAELPPTEDPDTFASGGTFRFDCLNVYANAPVDAPIPDAPPVVPDARFRLFLNFQRQNPAGRDPSIAFREAPLTPQGAIYEQGIPADVPFFGQVVDSRGRVLVTPSGMPAHVAGFGAGRRSGWAQCVGCHAGHSVMKIANTFSDAEWFNVSTSARVEASSEWMPAGRREPPGPGRRVVDRRARSGGLEAAWVAADTRDAWVRLAWQVPIEVSRFVLYGIAPDPGGETDLEVEDCLITLLRDGIPVARARSGPVSPGGTTVDVPKSRIHEVKIELLRSRGRIGGLPLTGLAEVETIARLAPDEPHP